MSADSDARTDEPLPVAGRRWIASRPLLALAPVLLVLGAAALLIDEPLGRWCLADECPGFLRELFELVEVFGHGLGVVLIVLVVHQLDPPRRWALPRVLACSLGAGLAVDVVKLLVARARPHHFDFEGGIWASFGGWFPLLSAGSAGQSFPSAHTATAVGLAAALAWLYPQGRRVFVVLAVLVACQRVEGGAHFPSDVLCGAAVGCLVAAACLEFSRLPGRFDRLERRLGRPAPPASLGPPDGQQQAGSLAA